MRTVGRWTPSELAGRVSKSVQFSSSWGEVIADAAERLHQDFKCFNDSTQFLLTQLRTSGTRIVRLAHQTNFLPYLQIGAQTVFLANLHNELTKLSVPSVGIVLIVDYDVPKSSKWICNAYVTDSTVKNHVRRFHIPITSKKRSVPLYLSEPPSDNTRMSIVRDLFQYAEYFGGDSEFLIETSGVNNCAACLSDFNLFYWINLSIDVWRLPLLFVRLSDIAFRFENERHLLTESVARLTSTAIEDHLWRICEECSRRVAITDRCCGSKHRVINSIPKVLIDDLSDYAILKVSGGTAYSSGREHLEAAHKVGSRLQVNVPFESVWRLVPSRLPSPSLHGDINSKDGLRLIRDGRMSLIGYASTRDRAMEILEQLNSSINSGQAME